MQIKITTGNSLKNYFADFNPIKKDEKFQRYEGVSCFYRKHCHCSAMKLCLGQHSCYILQPYGCLLLHSSSQIQTIGYIPVLFTRYCLNVLNVEKFTSGEYYNLIVSEYLQTVAITFLIIMNCLKICCLFIFCWLSELRLLFLINITFCF